MSWKKLIEREYTLQYWEAAFHMFNADANLLGLQVISPGDILVKSNGRVGGLYCKFGSVNRQNDELKVLYSSAVSSKTLFDLFIEVGLSYVACAKLCNIKAREVSLSKSELIELYLEYRSNLKLYTSILWHVFVLNDLICAQVSELVTRKFRELASSEVSLDDLLVNSLAPVKIAENVLAVQDAICVDLNSSSEVERFRKKYEWLSCLDFNFKPLSFKEAAEIVKNAKKSVDRKKVDVKSTLKLTDEEFSEVEVAGLFAYLKDLRNDFRLKGVFYSLSLFERIALELNVSVDDLGFLLEAEVVDSLNGKPVDLGEINTRRKGYELFFAGEIKCKSQVSKLDSNLIEQREVCGLVASSGLVNGVARIVKSVRDLDKVKHGDILIAVTTNPNYITAMHKAAAIVTDEGGITSHAAIVSRELGIPCIVGTKLGTRMFKDGDLVDVDASTGVVNLLNRNPHTH